MESGRKFFQNARRTRTTTTASRSLFHSCLAALLIAPVFCPSLSADDLYHREIRPLLAQKCAACHGFEKGGPNKVGPNLYGVVGQPKASHDGYSYSAALASFSDPKEWTYESLNKFLLKPTDYIPGTKMNFAGLRKVSDRADLIAYMRSQSDNPPPLPSAEEVQAAKEAFDAAKPGG